MLETGRERPQLAAIERADECRQEIPVQRAGRQRNLRIERLDISTADRLTLIDAHIERPPVVHLPALRETDIREHARSVLARLLIEARSKLGTLPRGAAHADACHVRIEALAVRVFVLREEARFRAPVIVESDDRAIREIDAAVLAAQREILRGTQCEQIAEQIHAAVDEGLLRLRFASLRSRVRNVPRAETRRVVVRFIAHLAAHELACGACIQHFLAEGLSFDRDLLRKAVATVETRFARAGVERELLAETEAAFLLAQIHARIELLSDMLELREVGARTFAARRIVRVASGELGSQLRRRTDLPAQVGSSDSGIACRCAFAQERAADLNLIVRELHRCAPARGHLGLAAAQDFVLGDDEDRVEARIAARHRLFEEQRAVEIVDAVVDVPRQLACFDDLFGADAIAHFDANFVRIDDERAPRKPIQPRRAVALQLVFDVPLLRLGCERSEAEALARIIRFEARERSAVARELGDGHPRFEIAEQRSELAALQLEEQFARRRRLETLFRRVAVQRIEAIRFDGTEQTILLELMLPRGIVRSR